MDAWRLVSLRLEFRNFRSDRFTTCASTGGMRVESAARNSASYLRAVGGERLDIR